MTYSYRNDALIDLPLRMAQHDPVNLQALDVSGNGYHSTFGDGSTPATYPTKLDYQRGYSFDGGDYLQSGTITFPTITTMTMACVVSRYDLTVTDRFIGITDTAGTNIFGIILIAAGTVQFYCGGAGGANSSTLAVGGLQNHLTCIGVHDGTDTILYLNGVAATPAVTPLAPGTAGTQYLLCGRNPAGGQAFAGNLHQVLVLPDRLSPIQVQDLHNSMLKKVNDV
jgi:hypothetical protein